MEVLRRNVLVVDDEPAIRSAVRLLLESLGYSTIDAEDGLQAIEICRNRGSEICAVLLDLTIPGTDGAQVYRELRALQPSLPVVLASGYSAEDVVQRFREEGLSGYLQKPFRAAELEAILRSALEGC